MYTQAFKEAVAYCKANNLFVGYGNPNGKVLVIGKEAVHIGKEVPNYGSGRPIKIFYMLTLINIIAGIKAKKEDILGKLKTI
ncbi:hypothetical protein [uncultured Capnocytophaga sp.]|uniref:hypothetical protein n=1 Tax=uncultured Capnocytophaga sp. TaxID=159273 RepID=UPI002592DFEF|nr:hypothetical protein [uncultured Capnocytophaga sp.]